MKITRQLGRDGTLGPLALNYLSDIPENLLFFREQQLRHPAALYNLSLQKLSKTFLTVVEKYETEGARLRIPPDGGFELNILLEAQDQLLHSAQEHLDDCYLILKTLIDPKSTGSRALHSDEYVLDAKLPGAKAFMQATADYKTSLKIVNKLKHNQNRLRGVGIYPGDGVYLGYYLEEPDKAGALGPSPEIHPDQGAFSFARDLKWRFFLIYSLSENLVKAVERALMGLHKISLQRIAAQTSQSDWSRLVSVISRIPPAIFPKELEESVATVRMTEDGRELLIKFPDRVRVVYPASTGRIRTMCSWTGDGFSRTFKLPLP